MGIEKDVEFQGISVLYTLSWLWITLGVIVLAAIFVSVLFIIIGFLFIRKRNAIVAKALETGQALPRAGRKKNKCPFCKVKLPLESLVTCPYCGAPITE